MTKTATASSPPTDRRPEEPPGAGSSQLAASYQELADLAGRIVHEIKNHLSTLSLNLQLLSEDLQHAETARERRALQRLRRLQQECQRLVDLSNDFLRFARVSQIDPRPEDLASLLRDLAEFVSPSLRQKGIELQTFFPADLPLVHLDRDMFQQALLNLIINAEQAMPQGGLITIQVERLPGHIRLSVIDTGEGMGPDVLEQIFRPFFSTRRNGSGLGLPTAKKIVEAHGGHITVQSEPGRGTRVDIILPAYAAQDYSSE
ncbi:MAG: ATP-binding protein [Gemmatales bacterium]|nr:ATP-binding protein [Gemmatales bacterium]MCS7161156.1 ATP-binding protein [Gemmatales bacterium]MDW8176359.1 ATP-binding protein [Gemmatales bacterium]MDW8221697.1 ATP-binding protein [Gemmatales bacterium]